MSSVINIRITMIHVFLSSCYVLLIFYYWTLAYVLAIEDEGLTNTTYLTCCEAVNLMYLGAY